MTEDLEWSINGRVGWCENLIGSQRFHLEQFTFGFLSHQPNSCLNEPWSRFAIRGHGLPNRIHQTAYLILPVNVLMIIPYQWLIPMGTIAHRVRCQRSNQRKNTPTIHPAGESQYVGDPPWLWESFRFTELWSWCPGTSVVCVCPIALLSNQSSKNFRGTSKRKRKVLGARLVILASIPK